MRVLLHNRQTGLYHADDCWVSEPLRARDFQAGVRAVQYASGLHLEDVELCFEFDEPRYNFFLSLAPNYSDDGFESR
jgi:hypothetical protein